MYREVIWANALHGEPVQMGAPCREKKDIEDLIVRYYNDEA